ncbi:MAG: glycosyltransferase [Planctomycetota bacterium]
MNTIRRIAAYFLLITAYCVTWFVAAVGRMVPRRPWTPTGRIMVTGTIFNPNWYLSHITPLVRSGVGEVILIIDEPLRPMQGVRFVCPPKWLMKLIGRPGAKAIWMLFAGFRYRPDLFMGYNLVAGSCTALVAGTILGRPSCYQMTGGQRILSTIGADIEKSGANEVGRVGLTISKAIERLAIRIIRQFELAVVRGNKGRKFLANRGIKENVAIITGSVKDNGKHVAGHRDIDMIFVGRLQPIKQVDQFIKVVQGVSRIIPSVRAMIVGDGPLMAELKSLAADLGVSGNIEFVGKRADVESLLARSRVFVLTSKSEGSSIAMAEAMMAGAVPVVADVGELGDLVFDGTHGRLIRPDNIDDYVGKALSLLQDERQWRRLSRRAVARAKSCSHVDVISGKWREAIRGVIERSSGQAPVVCHADDRY